MKINQKNMVKFMDNMGKKALYKQRFKYHEIRQLDDKELFPDWQVFDHHKN